MGLLLPKNMIVEGTSKYFQGVEVSIDYDLELLMTARRLNSINYSLILFDDPRDFIDKNIMRVKEFISTYLDR